MAGSDWCNVCDLIKSHALSFQCKRRFERDCKEADRAQQYFERMDADINVTKADVEKVCVMPPRIQWACPLTSMLNTIAWPSHPPT